MILADRICRALASILDLPRSWHSPLDELPATGRDECGTTAPADVSDLVEADDGHPECVGRLIDAEQVGRQLELGACFEELAHVLQQSGEIHTSVQFYND